MAIIEIQGGTMNHRYLMRKSKDDLASMYMRQLRDTERDAKDAERYRYLRKHHVREWESDMPHDKGAPSLDLDFSAEGHDLDAAIDRAMRR
ncbi:hypothetical protein [Pseudoxanthomonas koreensis]|uniref:hypothetical protein n=1 Tax=Pseudoxanthomonas koreensis TaxID=266061 RepID=UPI0035A6D3D1